MKKKKLVSIRLEPDLVARYRGAADASGQPMTRLMRDALAGRRLRLPAAVPAVNRDALAELGMLAADLHRLARTLDAGRSAAADAAVRDAVVSVARAMDDLRHRRRDPERLALALDRTEGDLRSVNAALHMVMDARAGEVDPATLAETLRAVSTTQALLHRVQLGLLGHEPGGSS